MKKTISKNQLFPIYILLFSIFLIPCCILIWIFLFIGLVHIQEFFNQKNFVIKNVSILDSASSEKKNSVRFSFDVDSKLISPRETYIHIVVNDTLEESNFDLTTINPGTNTISKDLEMILGNNSFSTNSYGSDLHYTLQAFNANSCSYEKDCLLTGTILFSSEGEIKKN